MQCLLKGQYHQSRFFFVFFFVFRKVCTMATPCHIPHYSGPHQSHVPWYFERFLETGIDMIELSCGSMGKKESATTSHCRCFVGSREISMNKHGTLEPRVEPLKRDTRSHRSRCGAVRRAAELRVPRFPLAGSQGSQVPRVPRFPG